MALHLTVSSLQRSHHILHTQRIDQILSVLPRSETDTIDPQARLRAPQAGPDIQHDWIEVADALGGEHTLEAEQVEAWRRDLPTHFPEPGHVQALIDHLSQAIERGARMDAWHLLIHCHGGTSRSTAAAYIALCMIYGVDRAEACASLLPDILGIPRPDPNPMLVHYADDLLGAQGQMITAIAAFAQRMAKVDAIAHA